MGCRPRLFRKAEVELWRKLLVVGVDDVSMVRNGCGDLRRKCHRNCLFDSGSWTRNGRRGGVIWNKYCCDWYFVFRKRPSLLFMPNRRKIDFDLCRRGSGGSLCWRSYSGCDTQRYCCTVHRRNNKKVWKPTGNKMLGATGDGVTFAIYIGLPLLILSQVLISYSERWGRDDEYNATTRWASRFVLRPMAIVVILVGTCFAIF